MERSSCDGEVYGAGDSIGGGASGNPIGGVVAGDLCVRLGEDLELGRMLVRPSGLYVNEWTSDDYLLTEENFGSVKKAYIVLEDDQTMKQDFQQWMIQNSNTQLDEVKLFKDCGHMIMLTKPQDSLRRHETPIDAWLDTEFVPYALFGPKLSPIEDLELAKTLTRPVPSFIDDLSTSKNFSSEGYGSVKRFFIVCTDNLSIRKE
ncbi:hypothetical protein ACFE04_002728 [Oxalis oulophora]